MKNLVSITLALICNLGCYAQNNARTVVHLEKNWRFINEDVAGAEMPETNTADWKTVSVPHDWAIKGPFDKEIDKQVVRVTQDLEKEARERTGRTGALPHIGIGWYRKSFTLAEYFYCPTLLKFCKSLIRITFQGNGPHGKVRSWSNDLKHENKKFSRKRIFNHKWFMAC